MGGESHPLRFGRIWEFLGSTRFDRKSETLRTNPTLSAKLLKWFYFHKMSKFQLCNMARKSLSLENIQKALYASWSKDTCWPGSWNSKNPAAGHCRVTSAVVYTLCGGEILYTLIQKDPLFTHYWNKLSDGKEHDFTLSQFSKNFVVPKGKKVSFKKVMDAEQIKKSYPILLKRVKNILFQN